MNRLQSAVTSGKSVFDKDLVCAVIARKLIKPHQKIAIRSY